MTPTPVPFFDTAFAIVANGAPLMHPAERMAFCLCGQGAVYCDREPLTWHQVTDRPTALPETLQVVGDLDSLGDAGLPPHLVTDLHDDQETNDLTKAFRWLTAHYAPKLVEWFCVTGKREDHTLSNLALIASFGLPGRIYTHSGFFWVLPAGNWEISAGEKSPISFLSFVPQRISATGVHWPVERLLLEHLWQATLNRTDAATVLLTCEAPLLVYQPWEKQS